MTREEAIKELRGFIGQLTEGCQEAIKVLIPELRESEDERIRKAILEFFKLQDDNTTYSFIPKKSILAWLEKQKPAEWGDDAIRKGIKEVGLTQYQINWLKNNVFPPKEEQKPAEWSEEDKHRCGDAIYFLEAAKKHYADTSEIELTIEWLKSLRPQPKQDWIKEQTKNQ